MLIRLNASIAVGLLSLVAISGCSRKPAKKPDASVKTELSETAHANQSADTEEAKAKEAAMAMDLGCETLLKGYPGVPPDARDWARRNRTTFSGGVTLQALVTSLSDAGAQAIVVFTNVPSCDYLIILTLPSDPAARQKVFTSDARLREVSGLEPTKDYGQKYLGYPFRRKP